MALGNIFLKYGNNYNDACFFPLFLLASFFALLTSFGISFHDHFLALPYLFMLIDIKFFRFCLSTIIRNYQHLFKYILLAIAAIAYLVFRSPAPLFYALKIYLALSLIIYFYIGFHFHGFKGIYLGFILSVIFSILQFLEANFLHSAFLSMDHISHRISHTSFYFGPMKRVFACYAPGVFEFTKKIFRVSSFNNEPGLYCSTLLVSLLILHRKKLTKFLSPVAFLCGFSKIVLFQIASFIIWGIVKKFPLMLIVLTIAISYLLLGNLWLNHLKRIKKYEYVHPYANEGFYQVAGVKNLVSFFL
jgi:hypothetical protein